MYNMAVVNNYKRHRFAGMTRQYDISWLVKSIEREGQLVPALLWYDGTEWVICDGFHRSAACNKLGLGLIVTKLPIDTPEYTLPKKILDIQLNNKMAGKIQSRCEAVVYLEMVEDFPSDQKMSQKELCNTYSALTATDITRLKKIKGLKVEWFNTLRMGDKVDIGKDGETYLTDSPSRILAAAQEQDSIAKGLEQLETNEMLERTDEEFNVEMGKFKIETANIHDNWMRVKGSDFIRRYHKSMAWDMEQELIKRDIANGSESE